MFSIDLYGEADGKPAGPQRVEFGGDTIDDAIEQAELLIRDDRFSFGAARAFKIYDGDGRLVYDSEAD